MSLLDQLWDDTVAGPRPESGLGKLRKQSTFSPRSNSAKESVGAAATDDVMKVTRSIMIVKSNQGKQIGSSPPVSPAGTTPPVSPFAETLMVNGVNQEEGGRIFGLGGGLHRMLSRGQVGLDPGALVLLTTCDI
ncbi:hypothetical protein LguiA_026529 [Lonicera macranthoides]